MNLYLAAVYTNSYMPQQGQWDKMNETERTIFKDIPFILESYHYIGKPKMVDAIRANNSKVFLDSGAFSAMSIGAEIGIDGYCDYIATNCDIIQHDDGVMMASVLDGIGDPLLTYQNQIYMEGKGVTPLPCFHFGEDERYLEWYVENYPYITIGGLVKKKVSDVTSWLDRIWERYLIDGSGAPKLKVHAFGVTTTSLMMRYPWYSVDSSSWIQNASFGDAYTSQYGNVPISDKNPLRHTRGQHLTTMTDIERVKLEAYFEERGFSCERLSTAYQSRAAACALGYQELSQQINASPPALYEFQTRQQLF